MLIILAACRLALWDEWIALTISKHSSRRILKQQFLYWVNHFVRYYYACVNRPMRIALVVKNFGIVIFFDFFCCWFPLTVSEAICNVSTNRQTQLTYWLCHLITFDCNSERKIALCSHHQRAPNYCIHCKKCRAYSVSSVTKACMKL